MLASWQGANGVVHRRFTRLLKARRGEGNWRSILGLGPTVAVRLHLRVHYVVLGDWWDEDAYLVGATVLTCLVRDKVDGHYETLWWNAVEIISR